MHKDHEYILLWLQKNQQNKPWQLFQAQICYHIVPRAKSLVWQSGKWILKAWVSKNPNFSALYVIYMGKMPSEENCKGWMPPSPILTQHSHTSTTDCGNFPHFTTFAPLLRYLYQISSAVHSLFWFSPAAGAVVSTEPSIKGSAVTHSDTHGGFAVTESSIIHLKNCWTQCQKSQQHVSLWSGKAISSVTASCPRLARLDMAGREDLCNVRGIG